jgi:hypothetical protein
MGSGKLTILRSGSPTPATHPPLITPKHTARLWLAASGVILALVPILVQTVIPASGEWVWWSGEVAAGVVVAIAGWELARLEEAVRKRSPAALVERLDGKDGDVILLPDDPDAAPAPRAQTGKPWERGSSGR